MELDSEFYGISGLGADATPGAPVQTGPLTWKQVLANALVAAGQGGLTAAQMALANQAQANVNAGKGQEIAKPTDWTKTLLIGGAVLLGGILIFKAIKKRRK